MWRPSLCLLAAALFICSAGTQSWAGTGSPCEREMVRASRTHGVPLGVLYAVGLTETGGAGGMRPYLLNVEGRTVAAASLAEAVHAFRSARRLGAKLIDVGCMQINHHFHGARFESVEAMLDPARNVDYAARFLKELRASQGNWTMAAARYNAGPNNDPAQKRYVCRVISNMVTSGFGSWTPAAIALCR
ncbi:transglycosylase SLT domain-containing protein [Xanthobacteraceae bacterium Astr-EGSB]|uniref:transglycosylase SLT domain-containing protein n=1 Tax=Astrobacterium formosum TaxID=3069710 RepID=UPI0027B7FBBB|nr:transglycosylase SLT domain-containing protein [Xanthobacteraceae bacterium Astr-EGSB]